MGHSRAVICRSRLPSEKFVGSKVLVAVTPGPDWLISQKRSSEFSSTQNPRPPFNDKQPLLTVHQNASRRRHSVICETFETESGERRHSFGQSRRVITNVCRRKRISAGKISESTLEITERELD